MKTATRQSMGAFGAGLLVLVGCSSPTEPSAGEVASTPTVPTASIAASSSEATAAGTSAGGSPSTGTSTTESATAQSATAQSSSAESAEPSAPETAESAIILPPPTGPNPTGTILVHLVDADRPDPLDPAGSPRELMVQLWYPALPSDLPLAPYAPPAEAAALQQFYPVPAGAFSAQTNSRLGADAAPGSHPVVFFHHGLCGSRTDSTIVAEQLASVGYVVVALGSTREMPVVEFPGGRAIATGDPADCAAGADPFSAAGQQVLGKLLQVRVDDVVFVADELDRLRREGGVDADGVGLPTGLAGTLMLDRMGIYGHSFGGGTAAAVLAIDDRFVAGVDLDGFAIGPVATAGLDKPFLVVGSSYHDMAFDQSWSTFLPALRGWHQWIGVSTAGHYRFIDLGGSAVRWGLDDTLKAQDPTTWGQVFGDIDDAVSQQINRDLVVGFFDQFLRNVPSPILLDPAAAYSELQDRTAEIGT